ncbi:MAG TPA: hypothetical protein DCL86_04905 [Bacteroidales bacterium]|jgi:hypothetical protein|nr:hypothetical protein [Bacteroidales bacterium]
MARREKKTHKKRSNGFFIAAYYYIYSLIFDQVRVLLKMFDAYDHKLIQNKSNQSFWFMDGIWSLKKKFNLKSNLNSSKKTIKPLNANF